MGLAHSGVQYRFTANADITAGNVVMLQTSGTDANIVPIGLYNHATHFPDTAYNNLNNTSFGGNSIGSDDILEIKHTSSTFYNGGWGEFTMFAYNDYDSSGNAVGGKVSIYGSGYTGIGGTPGPMSSTTAITGTDTGDKFYNVCITGDTWNGNADNWSEKSLYYTKYDASTSTAANFYRYFTVDPGNGDIAMTPEVDISSFGLPTTENSWYIYPLRETGRDTYKMLAYYSDPNNNNYGTIKNIWASDFDIDVNGGGTHPGSYSATKTNWTIGNAHVVNSYDISSSYQHKTLRIQYGSSTSAIPFFTCSDTHITAGVYNDDNDTVTVGTATTPTSNVSHNVSKLSADWDTEFTTNKILAVYDTGANNGNNYVSARVGYYDSGNNQMTFANTSQYASPTQGGSSGSSNITCLTRHVVGSFDGGAFNGNPGGSHVDTGVTFGEFWSVKQHKSSGTSNLIYMYIDVASNNSITFTETDTGVETSSFAYTSGTNITGSSSNTPSGANYGMIAINHSNPGLDIRRGNGEVKFSNIDSDNIIGIAPESVLKGEQVTIDLPMSVSNTFSGLTIGTQYYVDGRGIVGVDPSNDIINSNHYIGKALGTDSLFLNGDIFGRANTLDTVISPGTTIIV